MGTMKDTHYLTAPVASTRLPPGIPFIIGNEAAERFSFYGMRAILVVFMTKYLLDAHGQLAVMTKPEATKYYHLFVFSAYFFSIFGSIVADVWFGKYRTIIWLSLVYCLGHLSLALDDTRIGLFAGLALIAMGSGGIKPCVSANVGDQFGKSNAHLLEKVYGWFYLSINLGAFISTVLTPWLLEKYGPHVAFGVPGVLMLVATIVFWLGRYHFVHIPARGWREVSRTLRGESGKALLRLIPIYPCAAFFFSLADQSGSSWVLQAEDMDRHVLGFEVLESQVQAINPVLILVLTPFFTYVGYPLIDRVFRLTSLRKICIGLFMTVAASAIVAVSQEWIDAGQTPSIGWQALAYVVITAAEVMVSITCLEFSYTQAPREAKSFVMSFYLLAIAFGNLFTMLVNWLNEIPETHATRMTRPQYFWFFTAVILAAAVMSVVVALFYREKKYIQEEGPAASADATPSS